jgi:hypothetical protein
MYIWSIKALADELRNDQLTESKSFRYFFVVATLSTLSWAAAWLFGMGTPLTNVSFGFVFPVICLGTITIGLIMCFRSFQRHNGHQFIQYFICLLLPANIRAFVFCLPLYILAAVITRQFPSEQQHDAMVLSNAVIITITMVLQFVFVYKYLIKSQHPV